MAETEEASRCANLLELFGEDRLKGFVWERMVRGDFRIFPVTGCWYNIGPTGIGLGKDGYTRTRRWTNEQLAAGPERNVNQNIYYHQIAYQGWTGDTVPKDGTSHLCHFRRCFNPLHLVDESITANNSRQKCGGQLLCFHHGQHPRLVADDCRHQPRCIDPNISESAAATVDRPQWPQGKGYDAVGCDWPWVISEDNWECPCDEGEPAAGPTEWAGRAIGMRDIYEDDRRCFNELAQAEGRADEMYMSVAERAAQADGDGVERGK